MKKIFLLLLFAVATTTTAFCEPTRQHMKVHKTGVSDVLNEKERNPIDLPVAVYYDSDTNILEVWCDNDNIQAEVYVYDESEAVEVYSPYMNVTLELASSASHSIRLIGDGWEAEGYI